MEYRLPVHLNRNGVHTVEIAAATFEAPGSFAVALTNHGRPIHVHLRLDGALSGVASIAANNHYVEGGTVRTVTVEVTDDRRPVEGSLEVVTGYGQQSSDVPVQLVEWDDEESAGVEADQGRDGRERARAATALTRENVPVAVLAVLALAIAVGVLARARGPGVLLGSTAVLASVAAALYVLAS